MSKYKKITVKVKLFATFRQLTGTNELNLVFSERPTVIRVLDSLCKQYPALREHIFDEKDRFKEWNHALIDGRNIKFLDGLNTKLADGNSLSLFPPVAGGHS